MVPDSQNCAQEDTGIKETQRFNRHMRQDLDMRVLAIYSQGHGNDSAVQHTGG